MESHSLSQAVRRYSTHAMMNPLDPQPFFALFLLVASLLGLLGMVLTWRGLWPRRVGATPHCSRCNYIVRGIGMGRCPECGAVLSDPDAIVRGERPVRRGKGVFGIVMIVVALGLFAVALTPGLRTIDWYQYAPTQWVIKDYQSTIPAVSNRAWGELERRLNSENPPDDKWPRIIDAFLTKFEGDATLIASRSGVVVAGKLMSFTPQQRERFFAATMTSLNSAVIPVRMAAQGELDRMLDGGLLSDAQRNQIIETALAHQKNGEAPAGQWLLEHLGKAELADALSPAQRERFRRQCLDVTEFKVRPTVIAGSPVPFGYTTAGRGPGADYSGEKPGWSSGDRVSEIRVDGRVLNTGTMSGHGYGFHGGSGASSASYNAPGKHELQVTIELSGYWGKRQTDAEKAPARWRRAVTMVGEFEVLAEAPGDYITWVTAPPADQVKKAIIPQSASRSGYGPRGLGLMVRFDSMPVNVGFEVLGRVDGKEYPITTIALAAGSSTTYGFGIDQFPPTPGGKIDLIFRSSEKAVERTPDLYQAWQGELVFENVPVTDK